MTAFCHYFMQTERLSATWETDEWKASCIGRIQGESLKSRISVGVATSKTSGYSIMVMNVSFAGCIEKPYEGEDRVH